ncbi:MAG: AMP-binding protein [Polyangiaceae bacterium]|nr:AMP-binding protein [Polyangiaceae bacterium]
MRGTRTHLTQRWYDEGYYSEKTIRDVVDENIKRFGDKKLVVWSQCQPSETTLGECYERGRKLAGALLDMGFKPGDVMAMQMPSWAEAIVGYHACLQIGLIVLPIIHVYGVQEVDHILTASKAKGLITPNNWNGLPYHDRDYAARQEDMKWIVVGEAPKGAVSFEELEKRGHTNYEPPKLHADDVHVTNYTSGTTADPKGVLHTHNSLSAEIHQSLKSTGDNIGEEVFVSPNPFGHIAGMISNVLLPLFGGQDVIMMDGWDPGACLELFAKYKATKSGGAPFFLQTLLTSPDLKEACKSLRLFGCGGAGVAQTLIETAEENGIFSFRAYGSTEHPSTTSGIWGDPLEYRSQTDGHLLDGVHLKLVDEDGKEVKTGEPGEILSIGPDMCVGYVNEEHNDAFTDDGWYRTGDVGILNENNCLTITDRIKDIIIRGGENISAKEVEEVLGRHAKVNEAVAVAIPDDKYGEKVCVFVQSSNKKDPITFEELTEHFKASGIAKQKTPERLEFTDDFPRTLAGKVQKYKLRESLKS